MPASYCHLAMHIIFSTKGRKRWLQSPYGEKMHSYLRGIIDRTDGTTLKIGGIDDHVHILCLMPKNISVGEFLAKIKSNSSRWFRAECDREFAWQDGYAAFSVSKSNIPSVSGYIANQREHHLHTDSVAEFEAMLKKHWDPDKLGPHQD